MSLLQRSNNLSALHGLKRRRLAQVAKIWDKEMGSSGNRLQRETLNPAIFHLMGSPKGKIIYEIACGNGHLARSLVRAGAKQIWASDVSEAMIAIAKNKYENRNIHYSIRNAINFRNIPRRSFDIVLLNRAIGYVANIGLLLKGIQRVLKPGGVFIFTLSHPLKPVALKALGKSVNVIEASEHYLKTCIERPSPKSKWLFPTSMHRRPLSYYVNRCSVNGLYVDSLLEPQSAIAFGKKDRNSSIPMYLVIKTRASRKKYHKAIHS